MLNVCFYNGVFEVILQSVVIIFFTYYCNISHISCVLSMMKTRLLFFTLLYSILSFAQQKNEIVLNWTDNVKSFVADVEVTIPQFQNQYVDFDFHQKQLFFRYSFPVSGYVPKSSLQINNVVYESVTREQLGDLLVKNIPSAINADIVVSKARNERYASLSLSPIIKEGSGFKRIKSFSFSYSLGARADYLWD